MHDGVIGMVYDRCWLPERTPDRLGSLLRREEPGMPGTRLCRKHEEERRQRTALEDARVHWEGLRIPGDAVLSCQSARGAQSTTRQARSQLLHRSTQALSKQWKAVLKSRNTRTPGCWVTVE